MQKTKQDLEPEVRGGHTDTEESRVRQERAGRRDSKCRGEGWLVTGGTGGVRSEGRGREGSPMQKQRE